MLKSTLRKSYRVYEFGGKDHLDFFHRLSTQKTRGQPEGAIVPAAFLNANGTVVALFWMKLGAESSLMMVHESFADRALSFVDKFHFGEDLSWKMRPDFVVVETLETSTGSEANAQEMVRRFWCGRIEDFQAARAKEFFDETELDFQLLKNSIPTKAEEIGDGNIILEAPLSAFVHGSKGCYPGQEVVERINTYGNVAKKYIALKLDGTPPRGAEVLNSAGERVGQLVAFLERNGEFLGLCVLKRLSIDSSAEYIVGPARGRILQN